jgi:hypothetical protein
MARTKPEFSRCYICDRSVITYERDHFPAPRSLGGDVVMDICRDCHDMKDRIPLANWDPAVAFPAFMGLWTKSNPEERLLLAKMFHIVSQGQATINHLSKSQP